MIQDDRTYRNYSAEWGWIKAREVVQARAVMEFLAGRDDGAILLRNLVRALVIGRGTLDGAPDECCWNCEKRPSERGRALDA